MQLVRFKPHVPSKYSQQELSKSMENAILQNGFKPVESYKTVCKKSFTAIGPSGLEPPPIWSQQLDGGCFVTKTTLAHTTGVSGNASCVRHQMRHPTPKETRAEPACAQKILYLDQNESIRNAVEEALDQLCVRSPNLSMCEYSNSYNIF